jgi:two-component system, LytTR family, response regulator
MKILIVDDEAPARERLRRMLEAIGDLEVMGEAFDGPSALEAIKLQRPDVVFLDIEMPGCSGTEVAACLPSPAPKVVFCTAYEQYAAEAFDLKAVDYLLKPVKKERLAESVDRLRQPKQAITPKLPPPTRFVAREGERYLVIPSKDVVAFTSEDGVTKLLTATKGFFVDPTLNDLEERLGEEQYFRVSRAAILKLEEVKEVHPMPGGSGLAKLRDGSEFEVSRRRFTSLLEHLGKL